MRLRDGEFTSEDTHSVKPELNLGRDSITKKADKEENLTEKKNLLGIARFAHPPWRKMERGNGGNKMAADVLFFLLSS